ncbi:MAG: energy transducer TonB [Prevotella sp.]|nr:energy transducer TonB [Prevotella sp.]
MLMRNYSDLENIKRIVYLKDFQNNKYGIKSQSTRTLEHLKQTLYKVDGLNLCYNYWFFDSKAKDYIKQLETDHSEEFGYVYMIERISNVSFRVVYIHELTLKPSLCAIISYKTGKKPYTIECITTLTTIPSNIPPCYKLSTIETDENRTDKVFDKVEQMPSFPGGQSALINYLKSNIKYPVIAEENGIQGRVVVQFVIGEDGSISDVRVAKSVDPSLDKEAVRVIKNMPKWIPGKLNGQSVKVRYTMPVTFRLN